MSNVVNTYRVSWKFYKAMDTGGYAEIHPDPKDPFTLDKMVIFSPRQVQISPNQHQLLRLLLRRPAELPPGEYRAHLTFTRLPHDRREETGKKVKGQQIDIKVNMSFSIPVIVRSGDDETRVKLSSPQFTTKKNDDGGTKPILKISLDRVTGKFSTYGSIKIFWERKGQKEQQIGLLNNVALFPEINHRSLDIPLDGVQVKGGSVRVVYQGAYESDGTIWDEKIFPVGG
jgi:fimbrial chaperone protein